MQALKRTHDTSDRSTRWVYLVILVVSLLGFVVAWTFVEPAPPKRLVIATGQPEGNYHGFGQQYAEELAKEGITLELRVTSGAEENLELLKDPGSGVDVAFVQSGLATLSGGGDVEALASLYFEPCWVFHRDSARRDRLTNITRNRLAIGPPGSGTRAVARVLLEANGIPVESQSPLSGMEAAAALERRDVDAAFFVASAKASYVLRLLDNPDIELLDFARAEAYSRRHRWLSSVVFPEGAHDFKTNIPPKRTRLIAPAAVLQARPDLHPALVVLLLRAATRVHGDGGLFEAPGAFPSSRFSDVPMNEEARRYLKSGPPFLQRFLPFWIANFLERMVVFLVPLLTLLIPLFKIVPPTWRMRVNARINRAYRELRAVDTLMEPGADAEVLAECRKRIQALGQTVDDLAVPLSYSDRLYHLRLHLDLVRRKLKDRG